MWYLIDWKAWMDWFYWLKTAICWYWREDCNGLNILSATMGLLIDLGRQGGGLIDWWFSVSPVLSWPPAMGWMIDLGREGRLINWQFSPVLSWAPAPVCLSVVYWSIWKGRRGLIYWKFSPVLSRAPAPVCLPGSALLLLLRAVRLLLLLRLLHLQYIIIIIIMNQAQTFHWEFRGGGGSRPMMWLNLNWWGPTHEWLIWLKILETIHNFGLNRVNCLEN